MLIDDGLAAAVDDGWVAHRRPRGRSRSRRRSRRCSPRASTLLDARGARRDRAGGGHRAGLRRSRRSRARRRTRSATGCRAQLGIARTTSSSSSRRVDGRTRTTFRFHHILIRDAAYQGLLKRTRATLHERFVDWAESVNRERDASGVRGDLGYHLEQAYRYLSESSASSTTSYGAWGSAQRSVSRRPDAARWPAGTPTPRRTSRASCGRPPRRGQARAQLLPDLAQARTECGEFDGRACSGHRGPGLGDRAGGRATRQPAGC